ncbi:MAG TPA: heavy metal translocating P-type ATPase [bacterium]|nr:heavy metal translocating P-type ATPase [bacterium]
MHQHAHPSHAAHMARGMHAGHDQHAGHSPAMFRDRLALSLVLTLPILYDSEPVQRWLGYHAIHFPGSEWLTPVLAVVIYFYGGWVFVQGARNELIARSPGMMTLIALAITVAFAYSLAVSLGLKGMPFYLELATLIDVMLLGHWMEELSIQGAGKALEHLAALIPPVAHRWSGTETEDIPVADLREGDRIVIRPGEQIPADGGVETGASSVNEAFLTGESRPVPKGPGDEVVAGAVNGEGSLTVRVTRTGEGTTLSQITRLVEEAQTSRSRFQGLADRAASWLTLAAIGVGTLAFIVWMTLAHDLTAAITRAVTVLVIACPHALGLAIPLVIVIATGLSARHGILVRNREAFERAKDLRVVAFDKTGTLTEGRFGVRAVYTADRSEETAVGVAASLEAMSEHPLARAVVDEAQRRHMTVAPVADFQAVPGKGVEGMILDQRYRVGRPEWAAELGLAWPPRLIEALSEAETRGESTIALMDDRGVVALFALADTIRQSAREAIQRLRAMGVDPVMITGDAEAVARTVAQYLGIEHYHARVLPWDKANIVHQLKATGPAGFVGDGINDAPALLEADLGVAIGAGTNVAIESADLVLVKNDPLDVVFALRLSRATYRKMAQNIFWATGYNAIAIPLAAGVGSAWGVVLSPAAGALLMSLSTIIVAANATLLRRIPTH